MVLYTTGWILFQFRHLLSPNTVPGPKAEWLQGGLAIIRKSRIIQESLGNELFRVRVVVSGMVSGHLSDRNDSLFKAKGQ